VGVQVRILYVRNLMLSTDENTMRAAFERVTPGCIEKVKKIKDFGFVHFTTREAAEQARATMHESILEGIPVAFNSYAHARV
jgi:RNA recognition motif-containing protein